MDGDVRVKEIQVVVGWNERRRKRNSAKWQLGGTTKRKADLTGLVSAKEKPCARPLSGTLRSCRAKFIPLNVRSRADTRANVRSRSGFSRGIGSAKYYSDK